MNTEQLECAITESRCLSQLVKGVFAPDTLPVVVNFPSAYVSNTDPSHLPGKHWVVFWFENNERGEFYDSLGRSPESYNPNFVEFFKRNVNHFEYSREKLQSPSSDVCGYHVLFYLLMKCKKMNLNDIVNTLRRCSSPDHYVYDYVSKYFRCI